MIDALPLLLGPEGYQISRSVRLRSSASASFSRTPGSAGNRKTWTWSGWVKRGRLGSAFGFIASSTASAISIGIDSTDVGFITIAGVGVGTTTAVFRDPSAWYHVVIAFDTTQATSANRVKFYVNNVQHSLSNTLVSLNTDYNINSNTAQEIGTTGVSGSTTYFDGYLTEINFIDGQALTPSSFGETNPVTGVWQPKKYTGTYGTNGFYLNFSDNSGVTATTIGKDYSGNGNNWTPNNISVTAGVTYDSMLDVPTQWADGGNGRGNYATLNPLKSVAAPTNGNLTLSSPGLGGSRATQAFSSGKWYWEVTVSTGTIYVEIGVVPATLAGSTDIGSVGANMSGYYAGGSKILNGAFTAYGSSFTTGDVIGVAVDADANTIQFYKNNTAQGSFTMATSSGTEIQPAVGDANNAASVTNINFGQRPFAYTPPSGFKALNTLNLPTPTILKGNQYFDATLWTGNGGSQTIANSGGMQPDFAWVKKRSGAENHELTDAVRGANLRLASNSSAVESAGGIAFNSTGLSLTGGYGTDNENGQTYVGWQWKEGATQGFDIVTWTGTGAAQNISHNLGVAPSMIIWKYRSAASDWAVGHTRMNNGVNPWNYWAALNSTAAQAASAGAFNNTAPTSTQFTVGSFNANATNMVAYLFSEVAGFSKFGSYTGNGSTDGPFVFCGFRPRFVMIKRTDAVSNWWIENTANIGYNTTASLLSPNTSDAEYGSASYFDLLSNGFKLRQDNTTGYANASGGTYIFAAFAEVPFRNALAR